VNLTRYKIFRDIMQVVLTGVVAGVLFSMAVTGVVFLLSGSPPGNGDDITLPRSRAGNSQTVSTVPSAGQATH